MLRHRVAAVAVSVAVSVVLGILATVGAARAQAPQPFPARPLTLIMPIAAGSAIETHIRVLTAEAAKHLGQSVVVENRVGAGGKIGMQAMMAARNDGHTFGMTFNGIFVTLALTDPEFAIRPGKDYAPVMLTTSAPLIITASANAPFKDVAGMLAYARANPGKLSVGGSSPGSNAHLGWELMKLMTGTEFTVAIYKGEPFATTDLLNGLISALISSATIKPHMESGKVTGIATTGIKPWSAFANLPTVESTAGLKGFSVAGYYGLAAPAGTPPQAVARLNAAYAAALADPDVQRKLREFGIDLIGSSPEEMNRYALAELERWAPILKKLNLKSG